MSEVKQMGNKRIIKGLISIVIPHAGPLELLKKCIENVRRNTTVDYEIIIVADKCDDETLEYLNSLYREGVRLVLNTELMGAAVAANMGYMAAQGEYICNLNTDVGLTPGWLWAMKKTLSDHPEYGWVALTTKQEWGPGFFAGASLFTYEAMQKIGLLDEIFPGDAFSDDDYLRRMQQAGYSPHIVPHPRVDHPFASTTYVALYGEEERLRRFRNVQKRFQEKWGETGTAWEKMPVAEPVKINEVSIIIPTLNTPELDECVKRIKEHTPPIYELIIVADIPTPDFMEVLNRAKADGAKILINDRKTSPEIAWNRGVRESIGEYIVFMNSDTLVLPGWLEPLLDAIKLHPEFGWVAAGIEGLDMANFICGLVPRKVFDQVGPFEEAFQFVNDQDYYFRMIDAGYNPHGVAKSKVVHHPGSTTFKAVHGDRLQEAFAEHYQKLVEKWGQRAATPLNWTTVPVYYGEPEERGKSQMHRIEWVRSKASPEDTILEVGCAENPVWEGTDFKVTTLDKSRRPEEKCFPDVVGEAENLPFEAKFFDCIAVGELLEHVPDPQRVLKEAVRVARKRVIVTVPWEHQWPPELKPFWNPGHVRFYTPETFKDDLAKVGLPFKIEEIRHNGWAWLGAEIYCQREEVMNNEQGKKLNIGSFTVMLPPPWVNLDILDLKDYAQEKGFIFRQTDVTKRLPFWDNSADFINSSHLIEHLTVEEGIAFLKECRRVLKPGGTVRIGTPDVKKLAESYMAGEMDKFNDIQPEEYRQALSQADKFWRLLTAGHKTCYDLPAIKKSFELAGFSEVYQCDYNKELDMFPEVSLYLEARKETASSSEIEQFMKEKAEGKVLTGSSAGVPEYWQKFAKGKRI